MDETGRQRGPPTWRRIQRGDKGMTRKSSEKVSEQRFDAWESFTASTPLLRWAVALLSYSFSVCHDPGPNTRWLRGSERTSVASAAKAARNCRLAELNRARAIPREFDRRRSVCADFEVSLTPINTASAEVTNRPLNTEDQRRLVDRRSSSRHRKLGSWPDPR